MRPHERVWRHRALATAAAFLLASCSRSSNNRTNLPAPLPSLAASAAAPTVSPLPLKATRAYRIAFIPKFKLLGETGRLSTYWQPAWEGAKQAGAASGVRLQLVTSNVRGNLDADYVEPQIRLVADLIARRQVDGLVIAPFDSNRLAPVVEKAIAAGIPTVALDTPINSGLVVTFVAFDNFAAGKVLGAWVVQQLGGKGKVLILDGPLDQQNAVDRRRGFLAGLQTGNVDILNAKSGDWEIEPARQITQAWLAQYPEAGAILAANDNMALGAAQAAKAMQRPGLLITGFDATAAALAAIREGTIAATVDQSPGEQARLAILALVHRLETHATFPPILSVNKVALVTRENVDTFLASRARPAP